MPVKIVPSDHPSILSFNKDNKSNKDIEQLLSRDEFDRAEGDFDVHFKVNGTRDVQLEWHSFLYSELASLVSVLGGTDRLVIIHFGLDGDVLRYGFSFVQGTRRGDLIYDYPTSSEPTHILIETNFRPITPAAWAPLRTAYRNTLQVKRTSAGAFQPLDENDALRVVLPWDEEIALMYSWTVEGISDSFRIAIDSVSLVHAAQTHDGRTSQAGYRHGAALYVERRTTFSWQRMLDNDNHATIYKNRAADYGNLCPVRCNYYER